MPELKFFQKKDLLNQFGFRQNNDGSDNNQTNTSEENKNPQEMDNTNGHEFNYEDAKEMVGANAIDPQKQPEQNIDPNTVDNGYSVSFADNKKADGSGKVKGKGLKKKGKGRKDVEDSSSDSSDGKKKGDADADDGENDESKDLNIQMEKLQRKLEDSNDKVGTIYDRFDSIQNYQYETFKIKDGLKDVPASSPDESEEELENINDILHKTKELRVTFQSNVSSEPIRHRVFRYNNYLYGKYYELSKPFGPIAKSLDKCHVAVHVLNTKLGSLRLKLSKVLKFYKMMEKRYSMGTLTNVINNLQCGMDDLNEAIGNTSACCTHIEVATTALFIIKGTPLIRIEYLRFKIISTIIQAIKEAVEHHNRSKTQLLHVIHLVKRELDYVLKLNLEEKKNTIFSHRVSRMKQNIRTLSKMTIAASTQLLLCQTRYAQFEKKIMLAIPNANEPKVRLISLYENDSCGPLELMKLQFDEQLTVKNPSNDTICCKFGMPRADLLTHVDDLAHQLQNQLQIMIKIKSFIFRSKFLIYNGYNWFWCTGLSPDNESTDSAYRNMVRAIKNIKGCVIFINRCKMLINLIFNKKMSASVLQQVSFCVGAFIKEAVGNQMCARLDIKLAYRDLETSYERINASKVGMPFGPTIDIKKELSKVAHILQEADKTMVQAFNVAEWVGIREVVCERETICIDCLTLTRLLNNEIKYKF